MSWSANPLALAAQLVLGTAPVALLLVFLSVLAHVVLGWI